MKWYDFFSSFYDSSLEKLYFGSRKRAVELMELSDGHAVLDVACGTGANFKHLLAANATIALYGTDYSAGMLRKAQDLVSRSHWSHVHLFQADARSLSKASVHEFCNLNSGFDRIICVLGLSVIPDWELVLGNLIDLLNENGKLVIVDVFAERRDFNTWLVEKIAKADLNRKIWQALQARMDHFYLEYLPVKEHQVGGKLFVAVGTKRKNPSLVTTPT